MSTTDMSMVYLMRVAVRAARRAVPRDFFRRRAGQLSCRAHLPSSGKSVVTGGQRMSLEGVDRVIGWLVAAAKWLALPLIVLLFLQWPLRESCAAVRARPTISARSRLRCSSRCSVTAATRAHTHLAADRVAQHYSERTRRGWRGSAPRSGCCHGPSSC